MSRYRRVTDEERLLMQAYLAEGLSFSAIASKLGFDRSTISREVARNSGDRGYRVKQACRKADERQRYRLEPRKMVQETVRNVETLLKRKWSPEQISNRLEKDGKPTVADETIYLHIYKNTAAGGALWRNLRRSRRRRKRRFPSEDRRGQIKDATPLRKRGKKANKRKRRGHWERDCMIGQNRKNAVIAMVDRKSRYNLFSKIKQKIAVKVTGRTVSMLKGMPCKSITNDRGKEFADHKRLKKKLGVKIFFCDPYSSWQRGSNENRIGVLRQYLPKGCDISKLHWKTLRKYQNEMNDRPMKCLDWLTPHEVMFGVRCTTDL